MLDAAFATERPAQTYEDALYAHLRTYKDEPLATLRTRIATEYAELFVGPRKPLAPLYESVYVDPNERLFTQTTMDVRKFYEQQGLQPRQRNKIPDDAMALELEFMAFLCGKELAALQAGDKEEVARIRSTELEFLDKHLNRWARPFAERVAQAWCADYYAAWSRFVADFVEEDRRYLE